MSRGQNGSAPTSSTSPTVVVPALMAVAALAVCWLTADPTVLRAAATVVVALLFVVVGGLTRHVDRVLAQQGAELRARSRDATRLREATDEILEQLTTQRDEMARFRAEASNVREEAAALLEVVEARLGDGPHGDLAAVPGGSYAGPMTGPQPAGTPAGPGSPLFPPPPYPDVFPAGTTAPLPPVDAPPPVTSPDDPFPPARPFPGQPPSTDQPAPGQPPTAGQPAAGEDDSEGYLQSFSLDDDRPLTDYWARSGSGGTGEPPEPGWPGETGRQPGAPW